ncbi:MAG: fibronectin type III domain-containing protein [Candidatus Brocadiia bacterium]
MSKVRLNLSRLPIPAKIEFADRVVAQMTGNPNFTTPNPALADITAKKSALETAYNGALIARQAAKAATELMADCEKALDSALAMEALYVENASGGDLQKIISAGMNVKDPSAPIGALPAPADLSATAGDEDGRIDLNWEPVRGAKSYAIEMTTDPNVPESWVPKKNSTESFASIKGLTSGTKYWFRVAAVGAAGQGPSSDPATKYAP